MSVSAAETYVGVPVTVQIVIKNANNHEAPQFPEIPGATVRSSGAPSQSNSIMVLNGVQSVTSTLTYTFQVIPNKEGRLSIPAITVQADGQAHRTQSQVILVSKSETGDLLFLELVGNRESVYVGEQLQVTLRIWIKPYLDQRYQYRFKEEDTWSTIDVRNSQWGVFLDTLQQIMQTRRRPVGQEVLRKDSTGKEHAYYRYDIERTLWPDRPGQLDAGDVSVLVNYPTQLGYSENFFNRGLSIVSSRPVSVALRAGNTRIKPIPAEGRPATYTGAVGQYQISATAAPLEVAVGDPITLTLSISGGGRLEQLAPPPLPRIEALTHDFKVPSDPLAGEVNGATKRFSQSIRAKSDAVQAIPPIPFVYFDPRQEKFVTVATAPIPIKVKPAPNMAMNQIMQADGSKPRGSRELTEQDVGILANYTVADEVLGQQAFAPGWQSAAALSLSPLVFAISWLMRRHGERLRNDIGFARRRSAKRTAIERIQSADPAAGDIAAKVSAALAGYVADRCNLPAGGLTRQEVADRLAQRGVRPELVQRVDEVLAGCESLCYAGGTQGGADLLAHARECVDMLERERFG